jgi:hypothetical protein
VSSSTFYRVGGGERGGRTGKVIGRPVVASSMSVVRFGGEGKRRGEWGVKRGGGVRRRFWERRVRRGSAHAR